MKSVEIKVVGDAYEGASVDVLVDGEEIAGGHIGGEPEDNCLARDYAWVPGALKALAVALGADVKVTRMEGDDNE